MGTVYCTTMKPMKGYERLEFLCPTQELVYGYKYHGKGETWYTNGYKSLLMSKWAEIKPWLMGIDMSKDMTLLCYCREGEFCHRQLMAQMVMKWRPDLEVILH
jgi:uncharacterized protein YeaO (DUF488 family)